MNKKNRMSLAIAVVLAVMTLGGVVSGPMDDVEGDTPATAATLLVWDGGSYTVVDGYTDLGTALEYFNGGSSPAGSYKIVLNQPVTVPETYIIHQTEGKNLIVDGNNQSFDSRFTIYGHSRFTGAETVELKNIRFFGNMSSLTEGLDFIEQNSTESEKRYPHNVTISYCTFDLESGHVAMRFRQAYNIVIDHCTVYGGSSALWATGSGPITVQDSIVTSSNGLSFGTVLGAKVTGTTITATDGYGIRFDGSVNTEVTVEDSTVTAEIPVVVRKATSDSYTVKFSGENTMTPNNPDGLWFVAGTNEYGETTLDNIGTSKTKVNMGDSGLDVRSMHPVCALPGSGSEDDPYLIGSVEELMWFRDHANTGDNYSGKYVKIENDIDLGGITWVPIASFAGFLDGNGRTISNFHIDATNARGGFFNVIAAGSGERVHDLTLSDVTATVGNNRFGTLANSVQGIVNRVTVENVKVMTAHTGAWVGGMCAFMSWPWMNDCTVKNLEVDATAGADLVAGFACILQKNSNMVFDNLDVIGFKATVTDTDSSGCGVGGFVGQTQRGWENPKVINCDVSGLDITATGLVDAGGFIAWPGAHTIAENCTTQGKIDATGVTSTDCFAGGFFGNLGWNCDLGQMGHKVSGCVADVDVTTKVAPAGGFVGSATNSNNASMYAEFTGCTALGDITCVEGGTAPVGGFAGDADRGVYTDCASRGVVTNNGSGYDGGFIGYLEDVTPKYDHRYPAGTRDYLSDQTKLDGCEYLGDEMIGGRNANALLVYGSCEHNFDTDSTCEVRKCLDCGHQTVPTPHSSDSSHACVAGSCSMCGTPMDAVTAHDVEFDCTAGECSICHETIGATKGHRHTSDITCIDRTCRDCGTVVKATTSHDYRTTGYQKVCGMCGDTVDLPVEDDDDWYLQWLAQQQAKAEAERLAKEKAEQEAEEEEQKKVTAVALATGAAVLMALLMMSVVRRS